MSDQGEAPTRTRILESALHLFADHGFGSTSVKAIAARAGVSQGLMYTYFASKEALLRAIFEEGLRDVWQTLPERTEAEPLEALERLLRRSFQLVEERESLWRLLYSLRAQPAVLSRLGLEFESWNKQVEARLRELCERAGMERPATEAKILFAVIDGANQHRVLSSDPYPVDDVIEVLLGKYRR